MQLLENYRPSGAAMKSVVTKDCGWSAVPMVEDVCIAPSAVRSAARAFRVIEYFDEIRRPASAKEIVMRLSIPQSSASLLLNSMVRLGYLDYDSANRTFMPSLRVAVLATWRNNGLLSNGGVITTLEDLSGLSGLAACLTSRSGIYVQYVYVVQNPGPGDIHVTLTARRYAASSAAGVVLLAQLEDAEIRSIVHRTRAELDAEANPPTFHEVMARVESARRDGHFLSNGLVAPPNGAIAIALPQFVTGGSQRMAMSLAGRVDRVVANSDRWIDALRSSIGALARGQREQ